jgi:hypothetical protein
MSLRDRSPDLESCHRQYASRLYVIQYTVEIRCYSLWLWRLLLESELYTHLLVVSIRCACGIRDEIREMPTTLATH